MTHPVHHARRASLLAVLGALAALTIGLLTASPAQAANYQYWGYYQLANGAWTFAQKGPAETTPADGSVEGWRWAITEESGTPPRNPRVTPDLRRRVRHRRGRVRQEARRGRHRLRPRRRRRTAPRHPTPVANCATVPTAATGAEVLAAVATVRNGDGGLVCGIDNYPASGCGGQVATLTPEQQAADTPATAWRRRQPPATTASATPTETAGPLIAPAPTSTTTSSGVPVVVWVGLVILLLGVAALVWSAMRRRRQNV